MNSEIASDNQGEGEKAEEHISPGNGGIPDFKSPFWEYKKKKPEGDQNFF